MADRTPTPLTRRDFLRIAGRFGYTSTAIAVAGVIGPLTLEGVASAAALEAGTRDAKTPLRTLKFGASDMDKASLAIQESGQIWFTKQLEKNTDNALKVEFIGSNRICDQLDCAKKARQGIVDLFSASTQNSVASAPYYNVLDFPYLFPSRASQHHFFYSRASEALLREPLRRLHNIQFLYTHCELRGIMLGKSFEDKPLVTRIEDIRGTRNRVTGTQLGRIAMELMELNPVPMAWEETLDGLKQGLIDGAETWMSSAAYANMAPVMSQAVDLRFLCGTEHTAMNNQTFEELSPTIQDAVLKTAYEAQQYTQNANEEALVKVVGAIPNPPPETIFGEAGVRVAELSPGALKQAERMCSPEYQPEEWEVWRERLNRMSGGHDVYQEIYDIAREIPVETKAASVKPVQWWKVG